MFWTLLGASGTAAVVAGGVIGRLGLRRAHVLLFTAIAFATALLGIAPHVTAVAVASAVVYGAPYMALSGLLAIWSHQIFPDRPSSGFSLTVLFLGAGSILGPALFGLFADVYGLQAGFLVVAAVTAATLLARPPAVRTARAQEARSGVRNGLGSPCHET
ncbi:MAG: MFS transporter [Streptosporangiales bacterium]|nr:MFS transporter [Streptosporangiales bacterium]